MSNLEIAVAMFMKVFDQYAGAEGDKSTLTKAELKTLMEKELPGLLQGAKNKDEVDKLMQNLDLNSDSVLDFQEFVVLVGALACACHNRCCKK